MIKDTKTLLELCRHRFPSTRPHQSHRLELRGDTLVLVLLLGDTWKEFDFGGVDLLKSPETLLQEVIALSNDQA